MKCMLQIRVNYHNDNNIMYYCHETPSGLKATMK